MKQLLFAFMLFAVIKSNGQDTAYYSKGMGRNFNGVVSAHSFMMYQKDVILRFNSDTLEILRPDKIKFIKIGERIYKIESPTLMEIKRESNGYWLGNTFTMDTTIVKPMFEYNLINSDTLPLSKKPIKH